jgi:outer membrane receptor protein involved in Fe transport
MKKKLILMSSVGLILGTAFAQTAREGQSEDSDKTVVLDPFVVQSSDNEGYQATSTLAGTRLKTNLKDIASSITVVTRQFLDDTGVQDLKDLLLYTPGTEVAGINGNFSGVGGLSGSAVTDAAFSNLNGTTRIRGLSAADNVRDYFSTSIGFNAYNTESVEINRGANSVLYGLGSPAGIINTSLKKPRFHDGAELKFAYGSFGTMRGTLDAEKVLIDDKLSLRVAAVNDERKYQQDPAYQNTKRYYGVLEYRPFPMTTIRVNAEKGKIDANSPRILPPQNAITDWFSSAPLLLSTGLADIGPKFANVPLNGFPYMPDGTTRLDWYFNQTANYSGASIIIGQPNQQGAVNVGGVAGHMGNVNPQIYRGTGIYANPTFATLSPTAYTTRAHGGDPALTSFLIQETLTDRSVFDFYNKLLDGPNKHEYRDFEAADASISQLFFGGNAGIEVAYHGERLKVGNYSLFGTGGKNYEVTIDLNTTYLDGTPNPNFGRPFTTTNSGTYSLTNQDRDEVRATPFVKTDLTNQLGPIGKFLGRQVFTGILSRADVKNRGESGKPVVWDTTLANLQDNLASSNLVTSGLRDVGQWIYLGPSLANASTAAGANLSNVQQQINIASSYTMRVYNRAQDQFVNATLGTERNVPTGGSLSRLKTDSAAIVLQNYFYKDWLIGTYGWRKDSVKNFTNNVVPRGPDNRALLGPNDFYLSSTPNITVKPTNITWGLVGNLPESITRRLPLDIEISPFFGRSENQVVSAVNRDLYGNALPPPSGRTEEIGVNVSFLKRKFSLKVDWYETSSNNQPIAGFSTYINNYIGRDNSFFLVKDQVVAANPFGQADIAQLLNYPDLSDRIKSAWNFQTVNSTTRNYVAPAGMTDISSLTSKGTEFELTANITRNWRLMANLTHQEVMRQNSAPAFQEYLNERQAQISQFFKFPPNVGGSEPIGTVFGRDVLAPVASVTRQDGKPITNEIRPWRFNLITNYTFSGDSFAKGVQVGGAVRWQDKVGIGYPVITDPTYGLVPDVANPYYGPTETAVDVWAGYEKKFSKFTWGLRLNVTNALGKDDLIPVATNPDGKYATYRIPEGRVWEFETSIRF